MRTILESGSLSHCLNRHGSLRVTCIIVFEFLSWELHLDAFIRRAYALNETKAEGKGRGKGIACIMCWLVGIA
jgi:hypothetical protein